MTTRQRWVCFGIGVVLGGLLAVAVRLRTRPIGSQADPPSLELSAELPPRPHDYVGSQACAECHADLFDAYQGHPMAQSLAPVLQARVIENYGAVFPSEARALAEAAPGSDGDNPSGLAEPQQGVRFAANSRLEYQVQRTTEAVLHHEIGLDAEHEVIYDQAVAVQYAVGSGRHGRSYLTERDGLLYVSPISWYTKSQRWDLSPGYPPTGHPRFERLATEPCLQCHAGRLAEPREGFQTAGNLLPKYQDPPFLEYGIGCERCHGPGGRHIAFQRDGVGQDAMINPNSLAPSRREAVCNQCHLHGEHRSLRRGRSDRDFRPGDHLNDIWTVLIPNPSTTDASHSVSHVEQMRISACYQADPQRLSCGSCHDPHQRAPQDDKAGYYRQRCLTCHAMESCSDTPPHRKAAGDACAQCHMPRQATEDVPHTTQTDHRVLRRPELSQRKEQSPAEQSSPASWVLFEQDAAPLAVADRDRAIGLALADAAPWRADDADARRAVDLLSAAVRADAKDAPAWHALGVAHMATGEERLAVEAWEEAVELDPRRQDTLYALGDHFLRTGQSTEAESYYDRLTRLNPFRADIRRRHSEALAQLGVLGEALREAAEAVRINPARTDLQQWRIELLRQAGKTTERREAEQVLQRMQQPAP